MRRPAVSAQSSGTDRVAHWNDSFCRHLDQRSAAGRQPSADGAVVGATLVLVLVRGPVVDVAGAVGVVCPFGRWSSLPAHAPVSNSSADATATSVWEIRRGTAPG